MKHLLPLLLLVLGCIPDNRPPLDRSGPLYFEVELLGLPGGSGPDDRLDFSAAPMDVRLVARAVGHDRAPMTSWSGPLTVHLSPGRLDGDPATAGPSHIVLDMEDGVLEATLGVSLAYDQVRVWVSDEGSDDEPGSFGSGVAPALWFERPTVAQVQTPNNPSGDSSLTRNYVAIRGHTEEEPRELVVTSVLNDGFYVTDYSDPVGSYRSLFVFTFSRPDGLVPGYRLEYVSGIVSEYIGFTEMQFPDWKVVGEPYELPLPVELDPSIVCDDVAMEAYEAEVVRITDIESDIASGSDCSNYNEHGQWPIALRGGTCGGQPARMTVVNINTVPCYRFPECEVPRPPDPDAESPDTHPPLTSLSGVLRHVAPADPSWVIDVRDCFDFAAGELPDACDCQQLLARPPSGPRKAPQHLYRDEPSCDGVPYPIAPRLRDAR